MTVEIISDRPVLHPERPNTRQLMVRLTAPGGTTERRPIALAIVLDRSGSMKGEKIEVAKKATARALNQLESRDAFAIVAFDRDVSVLSPYNEVSHASRDHALMALEELRAHGTTNLFDGWRMGTEELCEAPPDTLTRCFLMTDGMANHGITDEATIRRHVSRARGDGVTTTAMGLGEQYNEQLLHQITQAGGGNLFHVESVHEVDSYLQQELGELLVTTARAVELTIEPPPNGRIRVLSDFDTRHEDGSIKVLLGDLVSHQLIELIFELVLPPMPSGEALQLTVKVADSEGVLDHSPVEVRFDIGTEARALDQSRNMELVFEYCRLIAAYDTRRAVSLNRAGSYRRAHDLIMESAHRIRCLAEGEERILRIARSAERRAAELGERMAERSRKRHHNRCSQVMKCRDETTTVPRTRC